MEQEIFSESLFNDGFIVKKFQNEIIKTGRRGEWVSQLFGYVHSLTDLCRSKGFKSVIEMYDNIEDDFLKDYIYLVGNVVSQPSDITYVSFLMKPRFYNEEFSGLKFVKAVLYYEAFLQMIVGETYEIIEIRLLSILGITDKRLKDMYN